MGEVGNGGSGDGSNGTAQNGYGSSGSRAAGSSEDWPLGSQVNDFTESISSRNSFRSSIHEGALWFKELSTFSDV